MLGELLTFFDIFMIDTDRLFNISPYMYKRLYSKLKIAASLAKKRCACRRPVCICFVFSN